MGHVSNSQNRCFSSPTSVTIANNEESIDREEAELEMWPMVEWDLSSNSPTHHPLTPPP
jgi:hypothetical protein